MAVTTILAGALYRQTEFVQDVLDPVTSTTVDLDGACGPAALAENASWSEQGLVTVASVYQTMRRAGLCAINGVSTIQELAAAARAMKLPVVAVVDVRDSWPDWHAWACAQFAAGNSVLLEFGQAWRLVDSISGLGENANTNPTDPKHLRFHFASFFGYEPQGKLWIACDPANLAGGNYRSNGFRAANVVQHYTDAVMSAAQPIAAISIGRKVKLMTTTGAGAGFDAYCSEHGVTAKLDAYIPLDIDQAAAVYDNGLVLWWHSGEDISDTRAGTALLAVNAARVTAASEAAALRQQLAASQAALVTTQAALVTAQADLAAAEAKAAQAPAPVPPTPAPAPDPAEEKFRTAVEAMRAALAALAA